MFLFAPAIALALAFRLSAQELEPKPADVFFQKFAPVKAPVYTNLLLQPGDQLAIIGDSITEQKTIFAPSSRPISRSACRT